MVKREKLKFSLCFDNKVKIHIGKEPDELASLLETFKLRTCDLKVDEDVNLKNSVFDKHKKIYRLIVMDDVSGVADISRNFANFLTILRKFRYHCIHVIAPATQIWQKIISQTNISNIFPSSVPQNTVAKIIQSNCIGQSKKYVPARSMWLNRVFTDLANSDKKHCLTIVCSNINKNCPGRYRTSADNPD